MPLARINGKLIYFAHIPKTGGSSVEAYLEAKGKMALFHKHTLEWSRCTVQHAERRIFHNLLGDGFCDAGFTVVRDPKARLVSEYRMCAAIGDARAVGGLMPGALRLRRAMRAYAPGLLTSDAAPFFPSFDRWTPRIFEAFRRDPYVNDNHIRPQVEFVDPAHRVFRFEDGFEPVFAWIDAVTGTPPVGDRIHLRKAGAIPVKCSPETDALIRAFYAEDYALLDRLGPEAPALVG